MTWGGRGSLLKDAFIPDTVNVNTLQASISDMCFCTFFADFYQERFFFSQGMLDAIAIKDDSGILLSDFLHFVSERDRTETAQKYRSFFAEASLNTARPVNFVHTLCLTDGRLLKVSVHIQVIEENDRKYVWGLVLDKTQSTPEYVLSKLIADRADTSLCVKEVSRESYEIPDPQQPQLTGTILDVSDLRQFKEIIEKEGGRHEVTSLPARKRLMSDIEKTIQEKSVRTAAIILVDIKKFHSYNDRYGRTTGDEILKSISRMIASTLPTGGSLFHINVDHFCILWPHASRVLADNYMLSMQEVTSNPIVIKDEPVYVSFVMSAVLFPSCGGTAEELLVNAEITLNKVKKEKIKRYSFFLPSDRREMTEKLDFEFQLTKSIRNTDENFLVYYQPLVDVHSGRLVGAEALLRWISPSRDIISPERVIAALESTGNMDGIGAWVLERGIRQCRKWLDAGADTDFLMHVNITAEDLMRSDYSTHVLTLLSRHSLNPSNLILEITETSLMRSISTCRQNLIRLRKVGVKISLDDFGTGYSSLNYLKELPVDEIKIDRSFLENIRKDHYNYSFISAMVILAHSTMRTVCVEGIETKEQVSTIRSLHADVFQGFHFGKPVSSADFKSKYFGKKKKW